MTSRIKILLLPILAALVANCATAPTTPLPTDSGILSRDPPMVALEGYRDAENFFVKFRLGDQTWYAGGNWSDRVELVPNPLTPSPDYATPSLVPIQYHQREPLSLIHISEPTRLQ